MINNNDALLFDKYIICKNPSVEKDYIVKKIEEDGNARELTGDEKDDVLCGEMLGGSIAFSKDENRVGWLHKLCYIAQLFHKFITGHFKKTDAYVCHGYIITGKGIPNSIAVHPYMVCDPLFKGIVRTSADYLQDNEVTEVQIFKPKDEKLRQRIKEYATMTAFPKMAETDKGKTDITQWKYYINGCAKLKAKFSFANLVISPFFNGRHIVSKNPSNRVLMRTSYLIADFMKKNQIMDENGKLQGFFCSSYVSTVLQGSFIMNKLLEVYKDDPQALELFMQDKHGQPLSRKALAEKIAVSCSGKDESNALAKTLNEIYNEEDLARIDSKYLMSARFVELADSLSFKKQ